MNSNFGEVFLFLTDLAWRSRVAIPFLVTTVFLIMDVRLQIEINIQSGQVGALEFEAVEDIEDDDNRGGEEVVTDNTDDSSEENSLDDFFIEDELEFQNNANHIRLSLGLS